MLKGKDVPAVNDLHQAPKRVGTDFMFLYPHCFEEEGIIRKAIPSRKRVINLWKNSKRRGRPRSSFCSTRIGIRFLAGKCP
jgi:hypothetical protein